MSLGRFFFFIFSLYCQSGKLKLHPSSDMQQSQCFGETLYGHVLRTPQGGVWKLRCESYRSQGPRDIGHAGSINTLILNKLLSKAILPPLLRWKYD